MARMLQALKNLEARTPRPAGPAAKSPAKETNDVKAESVATRAIEVLSAESPWPALPAAPNVSGAVIEESIAAVTSDLALLANEIPSTALKFDWGSPAISSFPALALTPQPEMFYAPTPPATVPDRRPACEIERTILRTLSNPAKAKPLREMASRLRKDLEQTAAKSVTFVALGPGSCHEAVLYAANLLVEAGLKVLLVDADFERRALSEALDYARETGLSDLLRSSTSGSSSCLATSTSHLSVLPVGTVSQDGVTVDSSRVGKLLEELAAKYDLLLIDGGRTEQSGARTLAGVAQAAYFVVQLGAVEAATAQAALADFRAGGARVLGCIAT